MKITMNKIKNILLSACVTLTLVGCGSSKRDIAVNVHSDPLGAYALMKVSYKKDDNSDWIFLGPTPIVIDKSIKFSGATSVSLKVIRPGFYEQVKTWSAKDFKREHSRNKEINWVPSLVKQ